MRILLSLLLITALSACAATVDLTKTPLSVATHADLQGAAAVYQKAGYPATAAAYTAADAQLTACETAITAAEVIAPSGPACASGPCLLTRAAQLDVGASAPLAALNAARISCKWPGIVLPAPKL